MLHILFWTSLFTVAYVYAGYPVLAWCLARLAGRPVQKSDELPSVTVLTAAHNEVAHIGATIQNKLDQDYPSHLLDVIVVSDASTDGTDDVVAGFKDRVRLIRQSPRAGKTAALNTAITVAQGEIIVFADANSMYARDAIRRIVANFADPTVGYVTGKMVYTNPDGSLVGDGCSTYMKYENLLRSVESRLASVIGVDGGIDAVRRTLYTPMRADQQPDFVLPLSVAEAGYRVVYEPSALLREPVLTEHRSEYRMRVRVSLRALWGLWDKRSLLNPFRRPLLAFQLFSHKVLRYLAFVPLTTLLISSVALGLSEPFYASAAVAQIGMYLLAALGWRSAGENGGRLVGIPYYFALLNVASAHAVLKFLSGQKQSTWAPRTG